MMAIMLGNLSIEQMEERTGITLSDEDREYMRANRQERVGDRELGENKWHCFDIPLMLEVHDKQTAEHYMDLLGKYDWSNCREALQISWEK